MPRGYLISVEGIDGSGGTTQSRFIREALVTRYPHLVVVGTKAPWAPSPYEAAIRALLKDAQTRNVLKNEYSTTLYKLFLLDRYEHWNQFVRPHLEEGHVVVTDRWHLTTCAYQSIALREAYDDAINRIMYELVNHTGAPPADLSLVLDVTVDEASVRMASRSSVDTFETDKHFQREVRKRYLELAEIYENTVVIPGGLCVEEVTNEALRHIAGVLGPEL